ncbi:MAG: alpha/beta hydrolase [Gammaproteobacteria bacterium]|nr:alpha/beta hydrolase [Gammaproteobacteria bacterium]MBU2225359.1 alpha/beta hydrolase [Gammaproteobacteria bacterium]
MKHQQSSTFLDLTDYQLHLRRLTPLHIQHAPVLMLHGAIENGRIFYSHQGKGLGCFLADQGFSVYCADFAGRGKSHPAASADFDHSQHQLICRDIPALIEHLFAQYQQKIHLVCHSWGGVVLAASLARFPQLCAKVASVSYFGTKRRISVQSLAKTIQVDWVWNRIGPWLCRRYGYLPAKKLRLGADNEPSQFLLDTIQWIGSEAFTDPTDQFDYAAAAKHCPWPASWFFAAINDKVLGHPTDVQLFMAETQLLQARFSLLGAQVESVQGDSSKANALQNNDVHGYDHISMLTHPMAQQGHFLMLAEWMKDQSI